MHSRLGWRYMICFLLEMHIGECQTWVVGQEPMIVFHSHSLYGYGSKLKAWGPQILVLFSLVLTIQLSGVPNFDPYPYHDVWFNIFNPPWGIQLNYSQIYPSLMRLDVICYTNFLRLCAMSRSLRILGVGNPAATQQGKTRVVHYIWDIYIYIIYIYMG